MRASGRVVIVGQGLRQRDQVVESRLGDGGQQDRIEQLLIQCGPRPAATTSGGVSTSWAPSARNARRPTTKHVSDLGVDRIRRIVEPERQPQIGQRRRRAAPEAPAATRRPRDRPDPRAHRARVRDRRRRAPIGPTTLRSVLDSVPGAGGRWPCCGTTPHVVLWPHTPHQFDGTRIEPRDVAAQLEGRQAGQRPRRRPRPTTRRRCASCPTGCWWCRRSGCRSASRPPASACWSCRRSPRPRRAAAEPPRRRASGTWSHAASPQVVRITRGLVGVLDRHRHAVQWADASPRAAPRRRRPRLRAHRRGRA